MNEFKDQLDAAEKDKVTKLITELREIAAKGQHGDASVNAEQIKERIHETQQASLGLFQKVYKKRNAENSASESSEAPKEEALHLPGFLFCRFALLSLFSDLALHIIQYRRILH
jgi:molecular chaperone DnaK